MIKTIHENFNLDAPPICIDKDLLQKFIMQYRKNHPDETDLLSDKDILNRSHIFFESQLSLAGMLVFSRSLQLLFPEYSILCMIVPGKELGDTDHKGARFRDNRRLDGPILTMLDDAVEFVRRNSRTSMMFDPFGKRTDIPEYPQSVVKGAILNALIHRDYGPYTRELAIRLMLFDDRLEIKYPCFYSDEADSVNTALAQILEELGETETSFSTIRRQHEFTNRYDEFTITLRPET